MLRLFVIGIVTVLCLGDSADNSTMHTTEPSGLNFTSPVLVKGTVTNGAECVRLCNVTVYYCDSTCKVARRPYMYPCVYTVPSAGYTHGPGPQTKYSPLVVVAVRLGVLCVLVFTMFGISLGIYRLRLHLNNMSYKWHTTYDFDI